jgi:penicillin-binding protein 1A
LPDGSEDSTWFQTIVERTDRYKAAAKAGMATTEIWELLSKPVLMELFDWQGSKQVVMSPLDSLRHDLKMLQSGLVAVDPYTGQIRMWVGGINYRHYKYDHVKQMRRQPGSTFKPFVYAVAVDNGYSPFYQLSILPKRFSSRVTQTWAPSDASTPDGLTSVPMHAALARSYNNATVNLLPLLAGNPDTDNLEDLEPAARKIVQMAHNVGIKSPLNPYPAIALGTEDVSLLEMASAEVNDAEGNPIELDSELLAAWLADRDTAIIEAAVPVVEKDESALDAFMAQIGK